MRIIKTKDNTYTLYSKDFNEYYHNINDGALNESLKKHVEPAFLYAPKKDSLTILDICFGLGYNTLSTIYYLYKNNLNKKVHIISPEQDTRLIKSLKDFNYPKEFSFLKEIIDSISKDFFYESKNIKIEIKTFDAREVIKSLDKKIDIVFQDPFSPKKNPLLWTLEYFKDISAIIDKEGVLTTYSIATPVRLALHESGFRVYEKKMDGVREQTIASKKSLPIKELDMESKKKRSTSKLLRDYMIKDKHG